MVKPIVFTRLSGRFRPVHLEKNSLYFEVLFSAKVGGLNLDSIIDAPLQMHSQSLDASLVSGATTPAWDPAAANLLAPDNSTTP